ncbi:uncharacterized protein LOC130810664 [Amaranthus tricolor]|uniref:uncharacterized protein LOC130810664 n=1 Tax=Amaranthus tricolor TaxID=29722 RepID=UPI002585D0AE|nr:uncharacterized protein LOC130810664 [Amaranthus tricolor]
MVFIDLEKAYDSIPRRIIRNSFKAKGILLMYIEAIHDMYDKVSTKIQTSMGMTEPFSVKVTLHQESTLKIKEEVRNKLDEWREVLEGKGMRISRMKTEYLRCDFSGKSPTDEPEMSIGEDVVTSTTKYRYLGSIIQSNWEIDEMLIIEYMRVGSGG